MFDPAAIWKAYKIPIILGSISLLCIAISLTLLIKFYQSADPIEFSQEASPSEILLAVDIEGAVINPGVYQLPAGARVEDAIAVAGGLSDEADEERIAGSINRAAKLSDGAKLYIPKKGDAASPVGDLGNLLNINSASASDLEALPGIGLVTAKKIIDGRPYQTLEELVSKKAISQSLFEKLKEQLSL